MIVLKLLKKEGDHQFRVTLIWGREESKRLVFMGINVRKFITLTHEFISHKLIIKINRYNNVINHTSHA